MVLFDNLELAEKSKFNPLKVLHSKFKYSGEEEGINFIDISIYSLDASKMNRALNLSIQNLEIILEQLIMTSKNILKNISEYWNYWEFNIIFEILVKSYYEYKNLLNFIKELTVYKQFESKNKETICRNSKFKRI